jgi:hypothetical protein
MLRSFVKSFGNLREISFVNLRGKKKRTTEDKEEVTKEITKGILHTSDILLPSFEV